MVVLLPIFKEEMMTSSDVLTNTFILEFKLAISGNSHIDSNWLDTTFNF